MLRRGEGSIVNVSSEAGLLGFADQCSLQHMSKHSLVGLTRALAAEWGGRDVRVNAGSPNWVKTEMDQEDQARISYTNEDLEGKTSVGLLARAVSTKDGGCVKLPA